MRRRRIEESMIKKLLAFVAALSFALPVLAQRAPEEGMDYNELRPAQATDSPGRVEVIEFFWYRCPHCYSLEPQLASWLKQLPKDVQFRRVPAVFNDEWAIDARIFYTLETLGQEERVHKALFDAIHQQGGVRLKGEAYARWVADWLAKQGIDAKKYDETFRSFTVSTKLRRASQMTAAYKFDGVPAIAVQGRWVVNASNSMLSVTSYLIDQSRKTAATAKK
jgi:protein dithiol oxidoreductase (disulfide-forming)